jgi:hypothetical protein
MSRVSRSDISAVRSTYTFYESVLKDDEFKYEEGENPPNEAKKVFIRDDDGITINAYYSGQTVRFGRTGGITGKSYISKEFYLLSNTTKTEWPELLNVDGEFAKQCVLYDGMETVEVIDENTKVTGEYDETRVRIRVNKDNKVSIIPIVG